MLPCKAAVGGMWNCRRKFALRSSDYGFWVSWALDARPWLGIEFCAVFERGVAAYLEATGKSYPPHANSRLFITSPGSTPTPAVGSADTLPLTAGLDLC